MTATHQFIARLVDERLYGPAERTRLRSLAGRPLDESLAGFDLFTGLWWPLRQASPQAPRRDVWNRYVVTTATAVLLIIAGYWAVNRFLLTASQKTESTRKMLAVLPFENLGSPEDEYFADGITDEITGKLAAIRELGVISRTSTMHYKKTTKSLKQVGEELGVDYIHSSDLSASRLSPLYLSSSGVGTVSNPKRK